MGDMSISVEDLAKMNLSLIERPDDYTPSCTVENEKNGFGDFPFLRCSPPFHQLLLASKE